MELNRNKAVWVMCMALGIAAQAHADNSGQIDTQIQQLQITIAQDAQKLQNDEQSYGASSDSVKNDLNKLQNDTDALSLLQGTMAASSQATQSPGGGGGSGGGSGSDSGSASGQAPAAGGTATPTVSGTVPSANGYIVPVAATNGAAMGDEAALRRRRFEEERDRRIHEEERERERNKNFHDPHSPKIDPKLGPNLGNQTDHGKAM